MGFAKLTVVVAVMAMAGLGACSKNKEGGLLNLRSTGSGPDEFSILPTKPLTLPTSYAELPDPTPGGGNLTDPTPNADAVAALGGNPRYLTTAGIPRSDSAIIASATRNGVQQNIRGTLAAEDKEFRSKNRGKLLERLFGTTVYFSAYREQSLDPQTELERMRRAGVRTPAAPPAPTN